MGYGIVPDIKDERVICQQPCNHKDCALTRKKWNSTCPICGKEFKAGQHFYYENRKPVHAICLEERDE